MIDVIFSIDYEIYGDGTGSLREHVYEPTERLRAIFRKHKVPFVAFVEAAELQAMEADGSDKFVRQVRDQVRTLFEDGNEIGLHLHPQWVGASYRDGRWELDYSKYNLCLLPQQEIAEIVDGGIQYLRNVLSQADFSPVSFRAGNWLLQPSAIVSRVLVENGIKIDSSVFKGGRQRSNGLDYRAALNNPYFWLFGEDVTAPDPEGNLLEVPTYCRQAPFWRMLTGKRMQVHRRQGSAYRRPQSKVNRIRDVLRPRYPLKFDFCRMTLSELTSTIGRVISDDSASPDRYKPIVAIGHTKDLIDLQTVDDFLSFLNGRELSVVNLQDVLPKVVNELGSRALGRAQLAFAGGR